MSAAAFVLAINLFVAGIFATAFGIVAAYKRSAVGARWLAFSYGFGALYLVLEFVLPYQTDHRPVSFGIFAIFLLALSSGVVGLARHYRVPSHWRVLVGVVVASLLINLAILDMPRDSLLRNLLYQGPYAVVQTLAFFVVASHRNKRALDIALLGLFALSALHFLIKPIMAVTIGSGSNPQGYLASNYAAYSQTLGALLLIANGLLMLLVIVRDVMAEITTESETDNLSGLLNRRGFEARAGRALEQAQRNGSPASVVVADLDHFKAINDSFGHEAGDRVIVAFARILVATSDERTLIGRLGGEEFAVFIPGANVATARLYAEGVRSGFAGASAVAGSGGRHSASFGVAALQPGDQLPDLLRRADMALYDAKRSGRDRVCVAPEAEPNMANVTALPRGRSRGSRQAS
ncbi:diguanylate cyclase [Devosia albogilva]|uniref:diguanylate cyclase n=1 Tax=Devosia albogilva TaxID=429726 RepID=A0ABW5QJ67_9HYPH